MTLPLPDRSIDRPGRLNTHTHTHTHTAAAASHPHPQRQQQPPQRQQQPPQQYRPSLLRPRPGAAAAPFSTLTHVDAGSGQPAMVHVGDKAVTKREAKARCRVVLPPSVSKTAVGSCC